MKRQDIIIIGNSIAADIMYGYLLEDKRYNIVGFAVDKEYLTEETKFGLPVVSLEKVPTIWSADSHKVVLGIGYKDINQIREAFFYRMKQLGYAIETYIHPSAVVNETAKIGEGVVILSNSVLEPFVVVGDNTMIWSNCTLAHHSSVEEHAWIASNTILSGSCKVKKYTFVGVGVVISNEVEIGERNIIGAGCLLTKNTKNEEVFLERNAEKHRFDAVNYAKYFLK